MSWRGTEWICGFEGTSQAPAITFFVLFRPFEQETARFRNGRRGTLASNPELFIETGQHLRDRPGTDGEADLLGGKRLSDSACFGLEFVRKFSERPGPWFLEQNTKDAGIAARKDIRKARGRGRFVLFLASHSEPLQREIAGYVDRNISCQIDKIDAFVDGEHLGTGRERRADKREGNTRAQGFHALDPGSYVIKEPGGRARFDFSEDEDAAFARLELEFDVEGCRGLSFHRADAHAGQTPNRNLGSEGFYGLALEL